MSFWTGFLKRADDVVSQANAAAEGAQSAGANSNAVATSMRNAFSGQSSSQPGIISRVGDAISNAFSSGPSLGSTITTKIKNVQGG